jgi:hypothetical protein
MSRSRLRPLLGACFGVVVLLASSSPALAIPAFARKTGMRCTSCHESWPVLNDFGRAYRDNGYQLRLGKDDPTTQHPAYWPVAIRITPHYEFNSLTHQDTLQGPKTLSTGGVADAGMDLLTAGTLAPNASFLVVPTGFASDGAVNLESYWVYLSRVFFRSDWFNLRIGQHEVDLPASAHRSINLTGSYLLYSYHPGPGSNVAAPFDLGTNQRGIEIAGHNRGSFLRYNLSIATANDTSGSRNAWDSPYYYGHVQKYWQRDSTFLSEVEVGAFGAYANYPTTSLLDSSLAPIPGQGGDLKLSSRYGGEAQFWLGPLATPLHFTLVYARGKDKQDLYLGAADQDGAWNGGFLEAIWVPSTDLLHWGIFGRYDVIRNSTQPVAADPKNLNDQDQITAGIKYTINFTNRAEYALHAEYSSDRMKGVAFDGSDVRAATVFLGIDFAF